MSIEAKFYRSGGAYLLDNGALLRDGLPRFEPGKFAGTRALRIEQGTTNLLTANQSSVETDSTGFSLFSGATGTRDTTYAFTGVAAFKLTFNATTNSGVQTLHTTSTQGTYVGRLRLRLATGFIFPTNSLQYRLRIYYSDATLDESVTQMTPGESWADLVTGTVTSNGAKTVSNVALLVNQVGTLLDGSSVWIDALQIERQSVATTWHLGENTRTGERCLVPATALFDPAAGTVEAWIRIEAATIATAILFDTRHVGDALASNERVFLRLDTASLLAFRYWNGSALRGLTGGTVSAGVWTHIAASWGSSGGKVYRDGALIASHADVPVLAAVPRGSIGGRADGVEMLNGLLGGMRFTRGRARTDAEILAAYTAGVQFVEDGDSTVFSFDGTLRSLLAKQTLRVASAAEFLTPVSVTASTSATNYPASNSTDVEFPLRSHRTTSTAQATLTCDFGAAVNFRALFVFGTNWEWGQLSTSVDNVTYVDVATSPFACAVDPADGYRKCGLEFVACGRYARVTMPVQVIDGLAAYFETPLLIFVGALDGFAFNVKWGSTLSVARPYQQSEAGAHDEVRARGQQGVTMQLRGDIPPGAPSADWQALATLGHHRKFLLFNNMGNPAEAYLMRTEGTVSWEEQAGYNAFSVTVREHIN